MQSFVFPGNIDLNIMNRGSAPFLYMRTEEFSRINIESEQILLDLIHCQKGSAIIYTGSGTGAMSAVVENYCTTKNKAFVINGGSFGQRWADLCKYYSIPVYEYRIGFGKNIDAKDLEGKLKKEHPDVLLCQHHETSSGQLFDLQMISELCRGLGISLVVDVISSFLAEPLNMDELGIDICITSSQKGLNIPPGLSIVFLNNKLKDFKFNHCGYYWDFDHNLSDWARGQTPFSPATILYLQLHDRLLQLKKEGGEFENIKAIHHRALTFRKLCKKYEWAIKAENPSFAITGFQTNDNESRRIFKGLMTEYDTYIMPSSIPGFYRVSHMGLQTDDDLIKLAERIHELEVR